MSANLPEKTVRELITISSRSVDFENETLPEDAEWMDAFVLGFRHGETAMARELLNLDCAITEPPLDSKNLCKAYMSGLAAGGNRILHVVSPETVAV